MSVASSGAEANDNSGVGTAIEFLSQSEPSEISDNGRFVVFDSYADNLVAGDTNGQLDVFRHDRDPDQDGVFDEPGEIATQLVSANVAGTEGDSLSLGPRVSADGSVVAFTSGASNLLTAPDHDANGTFDVYAATFDTTGVLTQVRIISRPASGAPTGAFEFRRRHERGGRHVRVRHGRHRHPSRRHERLPRHRRRQHSYRHHPTRHRLGAGRPSPRLPFDQ